MTGRPTILLVLAASLAAPAAAHAGGVLPLRPGFYVYDATACRLPPFADLQSYDGRGLGGPHSRDCRLQVLSRRGRTITARNTCIDAGEGPAPRVSRTLTLRLDGPDRYSLLTAGQSPGRFRWCPTSAVLKGR